MSNYNNRPKKKRPQNMTTKNTHPANTNLGGNNVGAHITTHSHTSFKGEIFQSSYPPPQMMEEYAKIHPQFPERIISNFEKESNHRRWRERLQIRAAVGLDTSGMIIAFLCVLAILAVGCYFMFLGHAEDGRWIICTVCVTLAIAFLTRGKSNGNQNKPK